MPTARRPRGQVYRIRPVFWLGVVWSMLPSRSGDQWHRSGAEAPHASPSAIQRWARAGFSPASRFSRSRGHL